MCRTQLFWNWPTLKVTSTELLVSLLFGTCHQNAPIEGNLWSMQVLQRNNAWSRSMHAILGNMWRNFREVFEGKYLETAFGTSKLRNICKIGHQWCLLYSCYSVGHKLCKKPGNWPVPSSKKRVLELVTNTGLGTESISKCTGSDSCSHFCKSASTQPSP